MSVGDLANPHEISHEDLVKEAEQAFSNTGGEMMNIAQCNSSETKQRKKIPRICCGVFAIFLSLRLAKAFSSAFDLA